jgi:SAM-dependent methyltransferase
MKKLILIPSGMAFLIFVFLFADCQEKQLDVPYLPTPMPVVEEMLQLADLKESDILYDLGCGDGRILVTAARLYGIHGIGVDLDPERIQESREKAREAGVEEWVDFHQKNLFETDFHDASVVTLYLLPSVNIRLRPKLLDELNPGTKVISHDFDMDEWLADKSVQVWADDEMHMLYFWVIPANVSGIWDVSFSQPLGNRQPQQFQFQQVFQFPQGTALNESGEADINNVNLNGNKLSFSLFFSGISWEFEGDVSGETIKGEVRQSDSDKEINWSASRRADTKRSLDPNSIELYLPGR